MKKTKIEFTCDICDGKAFFENPQESEWIEIAIEWRYADTHICPDCNKKILDANKLKVPK